MKEGDHLIPASLLKLLLSLATSASAANDHNGLKVSVLTAQDEHKKGRKRRVTKQDTRLPLILQKDNFPFKLVNMNFLFSYMRYITL